jgi:hypothetical protein
MQSSRSFRATRLLAGAALAILGAVQACGDSGDTPAGQGSPPPTGPSTPNPPVSPPGTGNPPVTMPNPPVANPPVTNPPVTNPPVTNPPVTTPPVTNPPGNMPPPTPPTAGGEPPPCTDAAAKLDGLRLVTVTTANRPIHLIGHPSDPDTTFIAERGGTVRVAKGLTNAAAPVTLSEPILTVQTTASGERGLLSLALHPTDLTKLYVFFNDSASGSASVVQEFTRNPQTGMATAGKELYRAAHSASNHQGGNLAFGADKMLYVSLGDNAQGAGSAGNLAINYGKIFRLDPATGMAPPGNHMGIIWSYGLRNPWRMSFDRKTGDLYIGDVGQGTEEVNFQAAGKAGINYGWSGGGTGDGAPVYSYPTQQGQNCVIGGYVYRGSKNSCMYGRYFFKDRARAAGQSLVIQAGKAAEQRTHTGLSGANLYSFGEDGAGELYMLFGDVNGRVARIVE